MKMFNKNKSIVFGLILCFLLATCGCGKNTEEGVPIELSYINKNETKLVTETHYIKGQTTKEMIVEVLTQLYEAPKNKELRAIFGNGMNIINYSYSSGQVTVALSEKYNELPKTTEVLVRAAIVRSLTNISDVNYVMLTVNGEPVKDSAGNPVGAMTADMFVDNATTQQASVEEKVTIKLYFANETGDGLICVNRELSHNADTSNVSMEKLVLEQLISGPANTDSYPTINPNTKLLSVTVKDRVCYVNFDSQVLTAVNNVTTDTTIYSIVNSLIELNNVNKVQISIDGSASGMFRDKYELKTLFERNLSLVAE